MTFLYDDHVFIQLLAGTSVLDEIVKQAQQIQLNQEELTRKLTRSRQKTDEAKLIAAKLTQSLIEQWQQSQQQNDHPVYVRDLVNLEAYLNFLLKTKQKAHDGKPVVIHQDFGGEPSEEFLASIDKKLYVPFQKAWWVHRSGLSENLRELDIASKQPGNEVMKPLVKGLIEQSNAIGVAYESVHGEISPYSEAPGQDGKGKVQLGLAVKIPDDDVLDQRDPSNKGVKKDLATQFAALRHLPFQADSSISPYDMSAFARNMNTLLTKFPQFIAGPLFGQIERISTDLNRNYAEWHSFINQIVAKDPQSNAGQALEDVAYSIVSPGNSLDAIFGSTQYVKQAANRLIQMINLTISALTAIYRSPTLVDMFGKSVIDDQIKTAHIFTNSLRGMA